MRACLGQRGEILGIAHAARRIQAARWCAPLQRAQQLQIRTLVAAHAVQGHDDDVVGPYFSLLQQAARPDELLIAEVQRQDPPLNGDLGACVWQFAHAFAAQYHNRIGHRWGGIRPRRMANPAVNPQFNARMALLDRRHGGYVIALADDGVKISDVQTLEGVQIQKPIDYLQGLAAAMRQRAVQWLVMGAQPQSGVNDMAVHKVNYRNQFEVLAHENSCP